MHSEFWATLVSWCGFHICVILHFLRSCKIQQWNWHHLCLFMQEMICPHDKVYFWTAVIFHQTLRPLHLAPSFRPASHSYQNTHHIHHSICKTLLSRCFSLSENCRRKRLHNCCCCYRAGSRGTPFVLFNSKFIQHIILMQSLI